MKISMIFPTRKRPELIRRMYENILNTVSDPSRIEVVLGVDADDPESQGLDHPDLNIVTVVCPALESYPRKIASCFHYATGDLIFSLVDDIVIHSKGWDEIVGRVFEKFQDRIVLVIVNDLLFGDRLCNFSLVYRKYYETCGVPWFYRRFRIDDHIHHTFSVLEHLGHDRIVYLPEIVFEHEGFRVINGRRVYENAALAANSEEDTAIFIGEFNNRKMDAYRLAMAIDPKAEGSYRDRLDSVPGEFDPWFIKTG